MGEFVGLVRWDGVPIDTATCHRLTAGIDGQPKSRLWREGNAAFSDRPAIRVERAAAPGWRELPSGAMLVADVRLDDRADTARALGGCDGDDLSILSAACARWGDDAPQRLYGDVAYAVWDARRARLMLARSALGVRTLYYATGTGWIAFATTIRALLRLPLVSRDLDDLAIANYMTLTQDPDRTLYRHIHRVPAGGTVTVERGAIRIARYWTPQSIRPVRYARDGDYVDAARELFDRAVANRLPAGSAAIMLSGGFDSTAIAATAARLLGNRRLAAYTRVPDAAHPYDTPDEGAHAQATAARYANIDWRSIDGDALVQRGMARDHALLALPPNGAFNPLWFDPLLRAADQGGAQTLFNGVAGNVTLTWTGVPPYREQLRTGRLIASVREVWRTSRRQRRSLYDVVRHDVLATLEPHAMRLRRFRRNDRGAPVWLRYAGIRADFLDTIGFEDHAARLGQDLPGRRQGDHVTQRIDALHVQYPRDMISANRCRYGFEREDPMSDRRLAEFTLGVPLDQYVRDGQNRWLARRVFADRVPPAVLAGHRTGKQSPEWYAVASARRPAIAEAIERLETSPAASRVIDLPRLRAIYDDWPKDAETAAGHQSIYRQVLHRSIMLGEFLRWHESGNS